MGLMDAVVAYLASQKLVLVAAESCTAGLVTAELAQVPGSGQVLEAGLTVYSPEAKQRLLGVAAETIDRWGLTSEAVARSEEHTSELQSRGHRVCRLLLEKKNTNS